MNDRQPTTDELKLKITNLEIELEASEKNLVRQRAESEDLHHRALCHLSEIKALQHDVAWYKGKLRTPVEDWANGDGSVLDHVPDGVKPLAVVEGYINPVCIERWNDDNNILVGKYKISPKDQLVTVIVIPRQSGEVG